MNAATAGGVLGAEPTVRVTHPANKADATCVFEAPHAQLTIEVATGAYNLLLKQCGDQRTAVNAIGNEAVECPSAHEEIVVGRVRDRGFLVRLRASEFPKDALRKRALHTAEQVAGILF